MELTTAPLGISVIVPVGTRAAEMTTLYSDYRAGLAKLNTSFEMIFVLDGPKPEIAEALKRLQKSGENITIVGLTREFGEATALSAGFEKARGEIILTLPAYWQIEGAEIPKLVDALGHADMAIGRRWPRAGGSLETFRRSTFHGLIASVTGMKFRDLGCQARAMKRQVLEEITLYGDQHRFLPVLANRQGFRVVEIDTKQSAKDSYKSGYPLREYTHRVLDILTLLFLVRFTKKPLRFFGMVGVVTFGIGALLVLYLVILKVFFGAGLADRPLLLLSSLMVVLGMQLFALGLLAELMIFTHARHIKDYQVAEVVRFGDDAESAPEVRAPTLASG